ncbi:MAG: hypothetical protein R3C28_25965 [Pirellulaceae bacterium]
MTVRLRKQNLDVLLQATGQQGGEGFQCTVDGQPHWLAKIYHQPPTDLEPKLEFMLQFPPHSIQAQVAWPLDMVEESGSVTGYVQPNFQNRIVAAELTSTSPPKWASRQYVANVARDICLLIAELHAERYLFPDLHLGQFLIHAQEPVVLVDTASCQFRHKGQLFGCGSVVPDVQAPELLGATDWTAVADQRDQYTDAWSLAIIVFQLATRAHPFDGIDLGGGSNRTHCERMQAGAYPYAGNRQDVQPPAFALPYAGLQPELRDLFERCFIHGVTDRTQRPLASEWADTLMHLTTLRTDSGRPPKSRTPPACHFVGSREPQAKTSTNWFVVLVVLLILWCWWASGNTDSPSLASEWWQSFAR